MSSVSYSGPAQTPESSVSVQYAIPETKVSVKCWNRDTLPKKSCFGFFLRQDFLCLLNLIFEKSLFQPEG